MQLDPMPDDRAPTCVLERIVEADNVADGALIGLHDDHSTHLEILPLLRVIADGRKIIAPRSARWSGYDRGGRFAWFSSITPPLVEPIGFGDALIQLESLLLEHQDEASPRGISILGVGQGGGMALILTALWPELISEVIAINALWPRAPGWRAPMRDMSSVNVLVIGGDADTHEQLALRRANQSEVGSIGSERQLADYCRQWMREQHPGSGSRL